MRKTIAALALTLCACAHAPRRAADAGTWVEAEGWAIIEPGDRPRSRARALAEAQRRAVEAATGVSLSARIEVRDALSVEQNIRARSAGVIARYEVLEERTEDGMLKLKLKALVLKSPAAGGTVAVRLDDAESAAAVSQAFSEKGFPQAGEDAPDYVVTGATKADPMGLAPGGFASYRARAWLKTSSREGKLLREAREASAADPVAEIARRKASESAAYLAAEALASKLGP